MSWVQEVEICLNSYLTGVNQQPTYRCVLGLSRHDEGKGLEALYDPHVPNVVRYQTALHSD